MSFVRRTVSLIAFAAVATAFGAPGCLPGMPALPATELPPAELPQAPEVQVPEFAAPEVKAPDGPEMPAEPPVSVGNCCIRTGKLLKSACKGAMSCCVGDLEDEGECEENKGFWFFTEEGCAGAC